MSTSPPLDPTPPPDSALANPLINLLAIALPVVMICAIVGYRKYQDRVMQRRIQRLNRIWQLDSSKKLS